MLAPGLVLGIAPNAIASAIFDPAPEFTTGDALVLGHEVKTELASAMAAQQSAPPPARSTIPNRLHKPEACARSPHGATPRRCRRRMAPPPRR